MMELWLRHWNWDRPLAVSNPSSRAFGSDNGKVINIYVYLSPSRIIWYRPKGGDTLQLWRWPWAAYQWVYGFSLPQVNCQRPGSAPDASMILPLLFCSLTDCVMHSARPTDSDVECNVAEGGSHAVRGLPQGPHPDQRRGTAGSC